MTPRKWVGWEPRNDKAKLCSAQVWVDVTHRLTHRSKEAILPIVHLEPLWQEYGATACLTAVGQSQG